MSQQFTLDTHWTVAPRDRPMEKGDTLQFPTGEILAVSDVVQNEDGTTTITVGRYPENTDGYYVPAVMGLLDEDRPSNSKGVSPR